MTKHGQTMSEAYKKVLLGEDNMDLMKKAAGQGAGAGMRGSMQTLKMKDGKLKMDTFTASAIMQIYKAVNDKNKKTMENLINSGNKAAIMKLQKFAMSKINSSYGEELDDEDKPVVKKVVKMLNKASQAHAGQAKDLEKAVSEHHRKDENGNTIPHDDEEELSESVSVKDFDALKKGDTVTIEYKSGMSSGTGTYTVTAKNKVAKGKVEKVTMKSTKNPGGVKNFLYKRDNKVGFAQGDMGVSVVSFKKEDIDEAGFVGRKDPMPAGKELAKLMKKKKGQKEEVDLDEGKMKELHGYISQGKSAKEIAKIMKLDVKTIKALMAGYMMSGYNEEKNCGCGQDPCVTYGKSVKEGARADARRAMRNDPVLGKRKDKDDDDDEASAADKKAASKNILMQLQKVVSLKGGELKLTPSKKKATAKGNYGKTKGDNFIEFSNGKKEKVDPKVAQAVFKKYMSMQRPIDKQKFTIKISKSYKDMLAALKESLGEAKSPLQRLKDFDKVRVGVGKKPIFKDNEKKDIKEEDEDVADARKEAQAAVAAAKDRLADTNAEQPRDAEKVEAAKENLRKKEKALKDVDDPKKTKARADAKKKKAENDKFKDAKLKSRIKIAQERVRAAKSGTEEHSNALDALQNAKDAYKKYKEKTKFGKVKSFMKKTAKGAALGVAATAKLGDSFDPTIKREAILDRIDKKLQEKKDG